MSRTVEEWMETWEDLDNRDMEWKDVTDANYHKEFGTVSCPHCGGTLPVSKVMRHGYCYTCGGKFREILITEDDEGEEE